MKEPHRSLLKRLVRVLSVLGLVVGWTLMFILGPREQITTCVMKDDYILLGAMLIGWSVFGLLATEGE